MNDGAEDFVFYGTPIEREEDTSNRKRKAIAEAGQLRTLPAWKQEVRDEEGRRRFHGAFTGGFSAGYYNTAGSKEGWTPQTFTSSRKNRAEVRQQNISNFLDDEDIQGIGGHALETSLQFDTFGFTAAELARKQAEKEQEKRPSAIPGPVPDELVLPAANSIGVKMLLKMGWRRGHSIRETHSVSLSDARREARKAFLAFSGNERGSESSSIEPSRPDSEDLTERCDAELSSSQSIPVFVLNPKQDLHGLGYDPFKHAPEFRDRKRSRESTNKDHGRSVVSTRKNQLASNSGKYAPGFGIGALEDLDIEDEDIYATGFEFVESEVEEDEPSRTVGDNKRKVEPSKRGALTGFKIASSFDSCSERFSPPVIPPDFEPRHKFLFPLETANKYDEAPPPEVPPPEDNNLKMLIDGVATLVARCGKMYEDLSKEKNRSNPLFSFLGGGNGYSYYARKLWEEKQRNVSMQRQVAMKENSAVLQMTAESRGRILGERPLERSSYDSSPSINLKEVVNLQANLFDTFTKPSSQAGFLEYAKPFKNDPAKQERFEQFLKDKYQGGLRSIHSGGTTAISESDRARERLDFEAAAEAIAKGEWNAKDNPPSFNLGNVEGPSMSGGVELPKNSRDGDKTEKKICPKREEFQWRPSPILCKRFDIIDPFMGKPAPLPRARSKMDSFIFTADSVFDPKRDVASAPNRDSLPVFEPEAQRTDNQQAAREPDIEHNASSVQRPVDLYKAIFSDDSDDDVDNASLNQPGDSAKKTDGVNMTLNRLVAGDFLESLGKELGLEVPMDIPHAVDKTNRLISSSGNFDKGDAEISLKNGQSSSTLETPSTFSEVNKYTTRKSRSPDFSREKVSPAKTSLLIGKEDTTNGGDRPNHIDSLMADTTTSYHKEDKAETEKRRHQSRKHRSHAKHHRRQSSSSDTDSSSHRSRSRAEKRTSSEGKMRRHSSHLKHKRNRSPATYFSKESDSDLSDDDRRDRRSRVRERHSHKSKPSSHRKYH